MSPLKADGHIPFDLDAIAPWYKRRESIILYCLLLPAAFITPTANGFDGSMTNSLQTIPAFQEHFNHPRGATLGFFGASQSLGGIVGSFLGPFIADRFGRRFPVALGSIILIGSVFGQTWTLSFGMLCAFKVVLGIGIVCVQLGAPVLVTELAHPKERVMVTNLYNTTIFIGAIIGAWTVYGTYQIESDWAWRLPCLLQLCCSVYQLFFIYLCPESPRWLVAKGKSEKARQILAKYHGGGDLNNDLVSWEMAEIETAIEIERSNVVTAKEILMDKGFRHRAFICICCGVFSQTSGNGLIAAYLVPILNAAGITDSKTITIINGCSSIWSWVVGVICAVLTSRLKRRVTFITGTASMLAIFVAWTIAQARFDLTGDKPAGYAVIALIFLYNAAYSFSWLYLVVAYPVEVSNYRFRARLWALTMLSIGLSGFFNSYVNPIGLENAGWKFYIYYDVWILIELLVVYFFFPETSGRTLEEIAVVFDGEKASVQIAMKEKGGMENEISVVGHAEHVGSSKV